MTIGAQWGETEVTPRQALVYDVPMSFNITSSKNALIFDVVSTEEAYLNVEITGDSGVAWNVHALDMTGNTVAFKDYNFDNKVILFPVGTHVLYIDLSWNTYTGPFTAVVTVKPMVYATSVVSTPIGLLQTLNSSSISVFSGIQPATANSPATGDLLYKITNGIVGLNWIRDPLTGLAVKDPDQEWAAIATASGNAGWFRICVGDPLNPGSDDVCIDGSIGTKDADVILSSTKVERGTLQIISEFGISVL